MVYHNIKFPIIEKRYNGPGSLILFARNGFFSLLQPFLGRIPGGLFEEIPELLIRIEDELFIFYGRIRFRLDVQLFVLDPGLHFLDRAILDRQLAVAFDGLRLEYFFDDVAYALAFRLEAALETIFADAFTHVEFDSMSKKHFRW